MESHTMNKVGFESAGTRGRLKLVESLQRKDSLNPYNSKDANKLTESDGNLTGNRKQYTSLVHFTSCDKLHKYRPVNSSSAADKTSSSASSAENSRNHEETSISLDQSTFRQQLEHDGNNRNNKKLSWQERQINGISKSLPSSVKTQHFLGYDWIAALMENDSNVMGEKESFFQDLKSFRKTFKDDCCQENYKEEPHSLVEVEPQIVTDALTKSKLEAFIVNDRLFTENTAKDKGTASLHMKDRNRKNNNVRLARVSIPQSVLQESYEFKPHRRGSFDSCDSFALRDHCLMGWENTQPAMIPHARSLDLSSEVTGHKVPHNVTTLEEAEKFYTGKLPTAHRELSSWRRHYLNAAKNMPVPGGYPLKSSNKDDSKQTTDELLNSTHLISYEMEKLKKERQMEKWTV